MSASPLLDRLIRALQIQPGVGQRSATRIAYHLLSRRRQDAMLLGETLIEAMQKMKECSCCRNYCETDRCSLCSDEERMKSGMLCVVESPSDVTAIESSQQYRGRYFVLHGHLSPMDGIGVNELGFAKLAEILSDGSVKELILATNPTQEGDSTAALIASMARECGIEKISKIASGVPVGGELDNVDRRTLTSSFVERRPF